MVDVILVGFLIVFFVIITGLAFFLRWLTWNIPVTVLRFMGNKQRPMVIHKKAKKKIVKGVPHLQIKGYKGTIRDFKSDFYWPTHRGKYGALVLWEFEDGWLTPAIPKKKQLTPHQQKTYEFALAKMQEISGVQFEYNPDIHHELKLKVVDDVDMEFLVEQLARQDSQYTGGFWAFMEKYGSHVVIIFVIICLLVGFIVYLKNAPNLGAQCLANLQEVAKQGWLDRASDAVAPKG